MAERTSLVCVTCGAPVNCPVHGTATMKHFALDLTGDELYHCVDCIEKGDASPLGSIWHVCIPPAEAIEAATMALLDGVEHHEFPPQEGP